MKWIRDNAITLLIVFGIGIALLLDHQSNHTGLEHQRTALVQACEQRNRIVAESNQRIPQHRREEHVVRSLLISAARAQGELSPDAPGFRQARIREVPRANR